ncbi:MAG: glycerol-3-phosphate 1-O-acyltransferase PlsY [Chloroflexota bacterium]
MLLSWGAAVTVAYLLGSIPSGLLIGKVAFGIDVREYGSRRTGATNVLRTMGKGAAAAALALDLIKAVLAVLFARWLLPGEPWAHVLAGLAAIAGHNWPVFFGFRGGRGVVVAVAILGVMHFPVLLVVVGTGIVIIWRTRFVSLASVLGAALTPPLLLFFFLRGQVPLAYLVYGIVGAAVIIAAHRDNISRLLHGTESRIGQSVSRAA